MKVKDNDMRAIECSGHAAAAEMSFDENYVYLLQQLERIDRQLQQRLHLLQLESQALALGEVPAPDEEALPSWLQARFEQVEASPGALATGNSRLGKLVRQFQLSHQEQDLLLLALLPHFDTKYFALFANAQGGPALRFPSVDLALEVIHPEFLTKARHTAYLLPQAPLLQSGLLSLHAPSGQTMDSHGSALLKVDPAVYHFLLGNDYLPDTLEPSCRWLSAQSPSHDVSLGFLTQLNRALLQDQPQTPPRLVLQGLRGSGRSLAVATAAGYHGRPTLFCDLEQLTDDDEDALVAIKTMMREVQLHDGTLILTSLASVTRKRPALHHLLKQQAERCPQPIVTLQDRDTPPIWLDQHPHLLLQQTERSRQQNQYLLSEQLDSRHLDNDVDLAALAQRFPIFPNQLPQTLQEAEGYRQLRAPDTPLCMEDLQQAFQYRAQQSFGELAQRIKPKRSAQDLIIPDELQQQLHEVLAAIQHRDQVITQGFGDKLHYGLGICTLFHGPSGAGKTMAAEVMAKTLGVDLIKIDLSTVVNKYIGETEKNLSRIFDLAAQDSGVLFFDEADALFGKRSETKDAQDRHANIEVSYLLQRLENHPGLVILSTNNRSHLDSAFSRRFTFIVKFSHPDHATRTRMWRAIWPPQIRLAADVDCEQLAGLADITGANIRNIALLATWLAAAEKADAIAMSHIKQALKRELAKTGQIALHA